MISVDIKIERITLGPRPPVYRAEVIQFERLGLSFATYAYATSIEEAVRHMAKAYDALAFEVVNRFKASGPNVEGPWVGRIFVNESLALKAALRRIATLAAVDQAVDSNARRIYDIARNAIAAVDI